jgi:hypothetical protein
MKKIDKDLVNAMVNQGLFDGTVKLIEDDLELGISGIGCQIGDYAFYFLPLEDEDLTLETVKEKYSNDNLANQITFAIYKDIEDDERDYYIFYLNNLYNIIGYYRIDYYSRVSKSFAYKMVKATSQEEAIQKSRVKENNFYGATLISYDINFKIKNS